MTIKLPPIPEGDRFSDVLMFRSLGQGGGRKLYECWVDAIHAYADAHAAAVSAADNAALQTTLADSRAYVERLTQRIAEVDAERDRLLNDIHSCGPTCDRAGCVAAGLLKHNSDMRAEITALRVTLLTVRANLLHRFPTSGSLLVAEIDAALGSQP